jgi:DNA polymerase III epsilon subunit family exonuclease
MGLRFRKSINLGGGVRLNFGKSSVGVSGGVKGARVSINSKGRKTTSIGIPGTGISYVSTTQIGTKENKSVDSNLSEAITSNSPYIPSSGKIMIGSREYSQRYIKIISKFLIFSGIVLLLMSLLLMLATPLAGVIFLILAIFLIIIGRSYSRVIKASQNNNETVMDPNTNVQVKPSIKYGYVSRKKNVNEFVAIDVETTGLDPKNDKIVEISAVRFVNGQIADKYTSLVNPLIHISSEITQINCINNSMEKNSPTIEKILPEFLNFVGSSIVVAHNASFDLEFIAYNCSLINKEFLNSYIDTLSLCREHFNFENNKLVTVVKELNIIHTNEHRSESDAIAAGKVYLKCAEKVNNVALV